MRAGEERGLESVIERIEIKMEIRQKIEKKDIVVISASAFGGFLYD